MIKSNNFKNCWVFNDGFSKQDYNTFPFAFRAMFFAYKKGLENKKNPSELAKSFSIISPLKKIYSYSDANKLATEQDLLGVDGQLNNREFKKKNS